jgi:ornithine cyclodeaminase
MRLLRQADIEQALPMPQAIRLMGLAFAAINDRSVQTAERQVLETAAGHALLMGASGQGRGVIAKLVTVIPSNSSRGRPVSSGLALLVDEADGTPRAMLDATALTAWRTAAAAGFATDLLARQDACCGLLVGSGTQARAQLLAMDAVRNLDEIRLFARDRKRVLQLIAAVQPEIRARLLAVDDCVAAVRAAAIITTATTSTTPVIDGGQVRPGCHINGIGSFRPGMCELDSSLVARSAVFVESRATAGAEAGELIAACQEGVSRDSQWVEIGEVVSGSADGRRSEAQITFYKSVGHAVFDLFAAAAVYAAAVELDLGQHWNL